MTEDQLNRPPVPSEVEEQGGLKEFRRKILELQQEEMTEGKTVHLLGEDRGPNPDFHVEDLTVEDMDVYKKLVDGTLTFVEIKKYLAALSRSGTHSERLFGGYLANRFAALQREQLDRERAKKE